ncbi:hypothetical protein NDU88_001865 [Pleurodeles waltl]|uniref:Uncharacterized protein n=1 Tax=Pleurodeles waltl TaxID=8319 RepID=A0AAV7PDQ6_PLEWA|nr:hypothetical protein NDU88_001865 [Pleurodeles waltl]
MVVSVNVAVVPPTGWRYIPPHYDIAGLAEANPPMYHTDCHGGSSRWAGDNNLQPSGRYCHTRGIMTLPTAMVFVAFVMPRKPWK